MIVSIHDQCIGCGICAAIASSLFKVEYIPAQVIKQPANPAEQALAQQAIDLCPVQAISYTVV